MNVTTLDEYQAGAMRTMVEGDDHLTNVLHCVLGMAGEAGEVGVLARGDTHERVKELGDCLWYAAVLCTQFELKLGTVAADAWLYLSNIPRAERQQPETQLWIASSLMADMVKKSVFYGRDLPKRDMIAALHQYLSGLMELARLLGTSLLGVGNINLMKLQVRYPEKFDADRAINRDLAAEGKVG